MTERCRLCTANDEAGLVEEVAEELWRSRDGTPWDRAGPMWQRTFREIATTAIHALRHGPRVPIDPEPGRIAAELVQEAAGLAVLKAQKGRR